jgi:hypothetical protein
MQKWYIVMAKPRQEHSSTSILGQSGIETYYPEVKECLNVGGRRRFRRSACSQAIFARFDYERVSDYSYSEGSKNSSFGHIPAEADPGCFVKYRKRSKRCVQVPILGGEVVRVNSGHLLGLSSV